MRLFEQYRPRAWTDFIGQDKAIARLAALRARGLAGRAIWLSGPSGCGKTSAALLIAQEVADDWQTFKLRDPSELTGEFLRSAADWQRFRPMGRGQCIILDADGPTNTMRVLPQT